MAMWQILFGAAIALIATFITIGVTSQNRRIKEVENITYVEPPGADCVICLETMENNEMEYLPCGHALHQMCIQQLRRHTRDRCPICRRST